MIKHYLTITVRHFWRNRFYSTISILGLSLGIAAFLLITQYIRFENSYETVFPKADHIYRVTQDFYKGSEYVVTDCETPMPLAPSIKEKMPEVIEFARFQHFSPQEIKFKNQKWIPKNVYAVDASAFSLFDYTVLKGDPAKDFDKPFTLVMTRTAARNWFGNLDVIGKLLTHKETNKDFKVVGVIEDMPRNTHLKFDLIFSFSTLKAFGYNMDSWGGNNNYTYVLANEQFDLDTFNKKLWDFSEARYDGRGGKDIWQAEPIRDIHLHSHKTFEPEANSDAKIIYFLGVIAIFIIFISIINYANLYAAKSLERAKEIGIRRILGSYASQMFAQNIFEATIFCLLSGIFSLLFIEIFMGHLRSISDQVLSQSIFQDPNFWITFGVVLVACIIASGLYAQIILSFFKIRDSLKGSPTRTLKSFSLQKVFMIAQFVATFMLVVGTFIVMKQINFMMKQDLGMNLNQVLVLDGPGYNDYKTNIQKAEVLRNELLKMPAITNFSSTTTLPGTELHELSTTTNITLVGDEENRGYNFYFHEIDEHYVPTLGIQFVAGKNFSGGKNSERFCIINEESARILGLSNPKEAIGKAVTFNFGDGSPNLKILGVVKNFHQQSLKEEHIPMLFYYQENSLGLFAAKVQSDNMQKTIEEVKATYNKVFPNYPFSYHFLDEYFNRQYHNEVKFAKITSVFSFLAIFISALGLLGLSTYIALRRTKEVAVRKVLGASVNNIIWILSKGFMIRILIACLIAAPITYLAMKQWLQNFAYQTEISWWIFVLGSLGILIVALLAMSIQTVRAATVNPVESLRQE